MNLSGYSRDVNTGFLPAGDVIRKLGEAFVRRIKKKLTQATSRSERALLRCYTLACRKWHTIPSLETLEKHARTSRSTPVPIVLRMGRATKLAFCRRQWQECRSLAGQTGRIRT